MCGFLLGGSSVSFYSSLAHFLLLPNNIALPGCLPPLGFYNKERGRFFGLGGAAVS